ncbi:MAG: hypothetical protein PHU85_00405 [Phycisphaerae bacterium]|nr:hypothetical protein [Phycisphaerae bacterium]
MFALQVSRQPVGSAAVFYEFVRRGDGTLETFQTHHEAIMHRLILPRPDSDLIPDVRAVDLRDPDYAALRIG